MIGDTELNTWRKLYYNLLVRLLAAEPQPTYLESLKEGMTERAEAAGQLNHRLGEGWRVIAAYLEDYTQEQLSEEYTFLFMGPHGAQVNPYESFYAAGGLFKSPLVEVREFMNHIGLKKSDKNYVEPEDTLAFELDIMSWLIQKQLAAKQERGQEKWLLAQADFLKRHLLVWAPACVLDLKAASIARFYRGVAMLLEGFLELEREHFEGIGPEQVETLEEARKRHGARETWRGPTYEPGSQS